MIKIIEISPQIYQIKITDPNEKNFHGTLFPVENGVSYGSYLIFDKEITLIDTFEKKYFGEVKEGLDTLLQGRPIHNIIVQHVEPDHSESFQIFKQAYPDANVYCSKAAVKEMKQNFFIDVDYTPVSYPDTISTGDFTFHFFETPNVHWPDNMWTYLAEKKILFSNDGFGQLIAEDIIFDDEIEEERLLAYSKEYYCNIVFPNNLAVLKTLQRFTALSWDIDLVCPSHGIIIKKHLGAMIQQYADLANEVKEKKAVIVYETIWGNTEAEANALKVDFEKMGIPVKMYQLSQSRISEIMTEVATAAYIAVGSGNQNNCMMPIVADFVERLRALKALKAKILVFGAYGWSQSTFKEISKRLTDVRYNVFPKSLTINFKLNEEKECELFEEFREFLKA